MKTLERLLKPRSIAVIGGGTWCENVIRECRKTGFAGEMRAVHPKRNEVLGCPAVASIADLPAPPDAVFIGINRKSTIDIVGELSARGAGGAVCFASGFSEASEELEDGADLQAALVAGAGDMPILGPNCYGFINALDGVALWPDQHGLVGVSGGVAIISQSSNIALNLTMQTRGLPIAYLITSGNQAQTGLSRIGEALLNDKRVTAIGLHIEGIDDLRSFESFARRAQEAGKPVVALKVGNSEQARAATISHTASLAGSMTGAGALFSRLGIAQVGSLTSLLETLKLLHVAGRLPSSRIASMSCSGGEASLMADTACGRNVSFPELDEHQKANLRGVLGPKVALSNPLDYHTYIWGDVEAMSRTFAAMMAGDISLGIVVLDIPRLDRCSPEEWFKVITAMERAMEMTGKPVAIASSLPENLSESISSDLISKGIIPFCGMTEAVEAVEAVGGLANARRFGPLFHPPDATGARAMSEYEAKVRLQEFGLRVPLNKLVEGASQASSAAEEIGHPVVLKSMGIEHKSEAGAVALDLKSAESVLSAANRMPVKTFLVEEMVTDVHAELLIGIVRDPAHGLVLTLAAGGVLTELLRDSVSLIVPIGRSAIKEALSRLSYARVLQGYRNSPACDLEAIVTAVMAVQSYAMSAPVEEVEINPLLCGGDFAIAGDALIKCGEANDS